MSSQLAATLAATVSELSPLNTRNETSTFLRCRPEFVSKLIDQGDLAAVQRRARGHGNRILIPRESILAYLERISR